MRKIAMGLWLGIVSLGLAFFATVEFEFYLWEKIAGWLAENPRSATVVNPKGLAAIVKFIAKSLRWGFGKGKDGTRVMRRTLLSSQPERFPRVIQIFKKFFSKGFARSFESGTLFIF